MPAIVVDSPRVRAAGSLGLAAEDEQALRAFKCVSGGGTWYEREALRVERRAINLFANNELGQRDQILLAEWDDELLGVAVLSEESRSVAHLAFLGIKLDAQGARIDSVDGPRLSDSFLESCVDEAGMLGFTFMTAQVARVHEKSVGLLTRVGFSRTSRFDYDYDLYGLRTG